MKWRWKMLKRLGFPLMALAGMLMFTAPKQANAEVRFGIGVGPAPAYAYDPYCSVYNPYCTAYAAPYVYSSPYVYGGFGSGHHDWDRDREFQGGSAFRGEGFRGGESFHGGGGFHGGSHGGRR
jgi:hypothetical protein